MELLNKLNEIARGHGIGRMDIVENRLVGIKSRGAYETPGGTLLVTAHRELESLALDRETAHYQQQLALKYAEMVYYGMWFTPLREALDAFFTSAQQRVTGSVTLALKQGVVNTASRQSPYSLYRTGLASFSMTGYNPKDAEGFINLFALPITVPQEARFLLRRVTLRRRRPQPMSETGDQKMWGGRFERGPDASFYEFERSWRFDRRMLPQELALDRAWAGAIAAAGILAADEAGEIAAALDAIGERARTDQAWLDGSKAEDVHHFVETALIEKLGPLGAKLHTGRSRNEMVATEFRMYVRDAAGEMAGALNELLQAFAAQAEKNLGTPMAGNTHMQRAQPILFSHWLLAHGEAFARDLERVQLRVRSRRFLPAGLWCARGFRFPDRPRSPRESVRLFAHHGE